MRALASQAEAIYEVGPSRPLRDFFKTINITCTSITTLTAAEKTLRKSG
jgi:[acyl-carrier-protein] S-malonyltransferase/trans-AT polyketide synthase/acyltransferase/oxidoreductase domain-containing protein